MSAGRPGPKITHALQSGPQARLTIGLLGHSANSDNLGVGALTVSHISILKDVCENSDIKPNFVLFGTPGGAASYVHAPNLVVIPMRTRTFVSPFGGLYEAVRKCNVICDITGGDSFADIYGTERFLRAVLGKAVVLAGRRPLILAPQTIGPFRNNWTKIIAKALMRRSNAIVSRDNLTSDFIRRLGLEIKLVESTDVAFQLPYNSLTTDPRGKIRVGLNISGLLFNGGYTRNNMFGLSLDYSTLARALTKYFVERLDCELHLISHVISDHIDVEDDYRVSQQLLREFPAAVLAPRFSTPSDAKSYIASMHFFSGSRMHACIAALSSGVPVVPIAYSRKFAGVFGGLGYSHVMDCQIEDNDSVLRKVSSAFENRDKLQIDGKAALIKADNRLSAYRDFLGKCFLEISERNH